MKTFCTALLIACLGGPLTSACARDTAKVLDALAPQHAFELSDGTHIVVQPRANSVLVRFVDRRSAVLHADDRGGFTSSDGQFLLKVDMDMNDKITAATLTIKPPAEPARITPASAASVVQFWRDAGASKWFAKDAEFDRRFRERFIDLHEAAHRGALQHWMASAEGSLALVLLLDQFPRNAFRGTARMYSTDAQARDVADKSIARRLDLELPPDLRLFLYLPFGHAEDLALQERSVELNRSLTPFHLKQALHHHDIVKRFGRFPHRNPLLGRAMTPDEQKYLDEGGYGG